MSTTSTTTPAPPELRRLRIIGVAFGLILAAGVVGYQLVADMSFNEALYMTVITVSTVGFGEVVELDGAGRLLTVALILGGVSSVSYAAVTVAEFVVEGHLGRYIERRRMERSIERLDGHVVVCGFGRVGRHLSAALREESVAHVIVENNEEKLEELDTMGVLWIDGDATQEHVLEASGLRRADALVACVNTDADNVLITLTSKGIAPDTIVIARAKQDENESKLRRAGADRVILPSGIGGQRIASLLTRPVVADFLEGLGVGATDLVLEEIPVRGDGDLAGHTLREARVRDRWGTTVLAVRHPDARMDTHPGADLVLRTDDVLIVMGGDDEVHAMRAHYR